MTVVQGGPEIFVRAKDGLAPGQEVPGHRVPHDKVDELPGERSIGAAFDYDQLVWGWRVLFVGPD